MTDEGFELSRRKMLAGLGAVGAASAGAGYGTEAFFSDREGFANNEFVAGKLDMKVGWEEHYSDWSTDESVGLDYDVLMPGDAVPAEYVGLPDPEDPVLYVHRDDVSTFQANTLEARYPQSGLDGESPCVALADAADTIDGPLLDLDDVKPGDFGEVTFSFALCDNPGYVWLTGLLDSEAENGTPDPEAGDPNERPGVVEITDEVRTAVWYDDCDNVFDADERVVFRGSLRDLLLQTESGRGLPLDGDPTTDDVDCFTPGVAHCLGFAWWVPDGVGDQIQTDSVTFDLGFYTEQCRHNDVETPNPPGTPPDPAISFFALCGDGEQNGLDRSDVAVTVLSTDGDGPTKVEWELEDGVAETITTAVVKTGTKHCATDGMTNVEYAGTDGPETLTGCQGDPADPDTQCPNGPAPAGETTLVKLEYENGSFVKSNVNGKCKNGK